MAGPVQMLHARLNVGGLNGIEQSSTDNPMSQSHAAIGDSGLSVTHCHPPDTRAVCHRRRSPYPSWPS